MVTKSEQAADLITSGTAARILGVSAVTVLKMAKDGRLPTTLLADGFRFFDRQDVIALARRRAEGK